MSGSVMIETLEDRRLLSASPLAKAKPGKIPSMLGTFTGTEIYSSGVTFSVTIKVTKQHGSSFTGAVVESSGLSASIAGTITRADAVRFVEHGLKRHHFSSTVIGTLNTDTLSATFTKTASGLKFHGSINASRPTSTSA